MRNQTWRWTAVFTSLHHSFIPFSFSIKVVECHCVGCSGGLVELKTWCLPSRGSQNCWGCNMKRNKVNSKSWCVTRIIQKVHSATEQYFLKKQTGIVLQHHLGASLRCRFLPSPPGPLNQNLCGWGPGICILNKILRWFVSTLKF